MKAKKKKAKKSAQELLQEQLKKDHKKAEKLEIKMEAYTKKMIKAAGPFKCMVFIMDKKISAGISRKSEQFTMTDYAAFDDAIKKSQNLKV